MAIPIDKLYKKWYTKAIKFKEWTAVLGFLLTIADESNHKKIEYLYNKYHDDMIRFARYKLKASGISSFEIDSEDVVQNSFLKIVKYIDSIDFTRSEKQLKTYVFSIVSNETMNLLSDKESFDDIDNYSETLPDEEFFERLQINLRYDSVVEKIKSLDEKYSITMLLHYCEEMDVRAIANLMEIPEKTVYTRLQRGKHLLLESVAAGDL